MCLPSPHSPPHSLLCFCPRCPACRPGAECGLHGRASAALLGGRRAAGVPALPLEPAGPWCCGGGLRRPGAGCLGWVVIWWWGRWSLVAVGYAGLAPGASGGCSFWGDSGVEGASQGTDLKRATRARGGGRLACLGFDGLLTVRPALSYTPLGSRDVLCGHMLVANLGFQQPAEAPACHELVRRHRGLVCAALAARAAPATGGVPGLAAAGGGHLPAGGESGAVVPGAR